MSLAGFCGQRPRYIFPAALGVVVPVVFWGATSWDALWSDGQSKEGSDATTIVVVDESRIWTVISNEVGPVYLPGRPVPQTLITQHTVAPITIPSTSSSSPSSTQTVELADTKDETPPGPETQSRPDTNASVVLTTDSSTESISTAKRLMDQCRITYTTIKDYSCTFTKRERMEDGNLVGPQAMQMKVMARPLSVYFKFLQPFAGREVIWATGAYDGKVLVHEGGVARLAGTLKLEPTSKLAMKGCRHPISEAGLGYLIEQVIRRWDIELTPGETEVTIHHDTRVGNRNCTMIESKHPFKREGFVYHKVKIFVDDELQLPIRFEAYSWPLTPDGTAELLEEYTYLNLTTNNSLSPADFDPANSSYGFTRF